jgi:hypothetical protein
MAITGLPPYKAPIEQSLRCACQMRYLVFLGGSPRFDNALASAAQDNAAMLDAHFVDARSTPWMNCLTCGVVLDFSEEISPVVM